MTDLSEGLIRFGTITWKKVLTYLYNECVDEPIYLYSEEESLVPRVKGDLAIRRMRLKDLLRVVDKDIAMYFKHNLGMLDIITYTNVMCWAMIWGIQCVIDLHKTGLLNSFNTIRTIGSKLSSYVKRFPNEEDDAKRKMAEFNCLTGYLQNDPDDFNFDEDFRLLATGGNRNDDRQTFQRYVDEVMTIQSLPNYISFEDFVRSGKWITSGSSSIGKVEWEFGEDSGHFKARKNMVLDLYTADEIYDLAKAWDGKLINSVFTKDELSKRRLAVASNLAAYINHSWIMTLLGHSFKNWNFITLDETPRAGFERTLRLQDELKNGMFALPWDFKGFDRQPNTWEVKMITAKVATLIRHKVPNSEAMEFEDISSKIVDAYDQNFLFAKQQGLKARQKGGIPSGIRPTSFIGNVWNSIRTTQVRDITEKVFGKGSVRMIGLRGDDTYITAKSPIVLLFFRYCYASLDVIGNNEKFGIMQNCCEFLRQNITPEEVHGWPNRAIPSIFQRKPWNPQPWKPGSDVATTTNNIYLLERRLGFAVPLVHQANKLKWSKFTNQSTNWLHLPVRMGGLGLYSFNGWVTDCSLPPTTQPLIRIKDLKTDKPPKWINLTTEELGEYYQMEFSDKIAADDVRGPQKHFGTEFINKLRRLKVQWSKTQIMLNTIRYTAKCPKLNSRWPKGKYVDQKSTNDLFPIFSEFMRQCRLVSKIKKIKMMDYIDKYYHGIYLNIRKFEQNGFHRTDAVNLALGIIPTEPTKILNPLLTAFVKETIYQNGITYWKGRKNIANKLYFTTMMAVDTLQSSGANKLFAY